MAEVVEYKGLWDRVSRVGRVQPMIGMGVVVQHISAPFCVLLFICCDSALEEVWGFCELHLCMNTGPVAPEFG